MDNEIVKRGIVILPETRDDLVKVDNMVLKLNKKELMNKFRSMKANLTKVDHHIDEMMQDVCSRPDHPLKYKAISKLAKLKTKSSQLNDITTSDFNTMLGKLLISIKEGPPELEAPKAQKLLLGE